jgi:plastocyanin
MNVKLLALPVAALALAALSTSANAVDTKPVEVTFAGKVVFDGKEIPAMAELDMSSKPEHADHCMKSADRKDRSMLVDSASKGIANVFVEIRKVSKDKWEPEGEIVLDQTGCRFEPHVAVVPVGATAKFLNSDPFMHNVNLVCKKNSGGNFGVPEAGTKELNFKFAEKINVRCDVHTWMTSYVIVTDNPFHAVTAADGSFSIAGVPPGEYEVRYWHETLGELRQKDVKVADGAMVEIKSSNGDWKE